MSSIDVEPGLIIHVGEAPFIRSFFYLILKAHFDLAVLHKCCIEVNII